MTPEIRTVRAKSDKIEIYRAALLYEGPLKKSVSTNSRVINEVVLEGKFSEVRGDGVLRSSRRSRVDGIMLGGGKGRPLRLERERGGERTYAPLHVAGRLHLGGRCRPHPQPRGPQRYLREVGPEHGRSASLLLLQLRRVRRVGHLRSPRREHGRSHRDGRHHSRASEQRQDHRAAERHGGHGGDSQGG